MAVIPVKINQFGVPSREPVRISKSGNDQIEWEGLPGSAWEVRFVQGPRPGKKSPFGHDSFDVRPKKDSGPQVGTADGEEYKYIIEGLLEIPEEGSKGEGKTRKLKITVDPTVIIRP